VLYPRNVIAKCELRGPSGMSVVGNALRDKTAFSVNRPLDETTTECKYISSLRRLADLETGLKSVWLRQ
jgi:hypothetical protein